MSTPLLTPAEWSLRWQSLRDHLTTERALYHEGGCDLADEGKDSGRPFGRVAAYDETLAEMTRLEGEQ